HPNRALSAPMRFRIDVFNHPPDPDEISGQELFRMTDVLRQVNTRLETIMATLDQIAQDVADESTLEDSLITLLQGVQQQLKDILSGATLPPDVQARVDDVFAKLEANKTKLTAAVTQNTPAATP